MRSADLDRRSRITRRGGEHEAIQVRPGAADGDQRNQRGTQGLLERVVAGGQNLERVTEFAQPMVACTVSSAPLSARWRYAAERDTSLRHPVRAASPPRRPPMSSNAPAASTSDGESPPQSRIASSPEEA